MSRAVLVSLSAPEMDRLAVELASRGALAGLVRRYANKGRSWERALGHLPGLGALYGGTFGRRLPPAGLDPGLVIEAGVAADWAAAVINRLGRSIPDVATAISRRLLAATETAIARAAGRWVAGADVVVASYHVAGPAFRAARAGGIPAVLNYPIAHHRWQYRFYAQQAECHPEFAAALPDFGDTARHAATLDAEIELADLVLVGSTFVRDTFIGEGIPAERLRIIPYGADTARFAPVPEAKPRDGLFRLVFVGQIGERKGISHLLRAYRAFRKADTELHLVGDFVKGGAVYGPYQDLFRHTPNVPQSQLPDLLREADVFVFPTLVEGMGMVVLEAMACGLPVIVTPNGPGDIVRDGIEGFVVPACDSDAIRDRLERLYADRDLRLAMGRSAREQAERWSWSRYAAGAADAVLACARTPP